MRTHLKNLCRLTPAPPDSRLRRALGKGDGAKTNPAAGELLRYTSRIMEIGMELFRPDHPLFKVLKGYILHCTSVDAYELICEDGFIRANDGNLSYTWKQSKGSCVNQLCGISLLDFGLPENKVFFATDQESFTYPWESILLAHSPLTVIVKINRDKILDKITPWEEIKAKTHKCLLIPYTEVCCFEPISKGLFEGIVIVNTLFRFSDVTENFFSKDMLKKLRGLLHRMQVNKPLSPKKLSFQ